MGCGSSKNTAGRDASHSKLAREAEDFFPPPSTSKPPAFDISDITGQEQHQEEKKQQQQQQDQGEQKENHQKEQPEEQKTAESPPSPSKATAESSATSSKKTNNVVGSPTPAKKTPAKKKPSYVPPKPITAEPSEPEEQQQTQQSAAATPPPPPPSSQIKTNTTTTAATAETAKDSNLSEESVSILDEDEDVEASLSFTAAFPGNDASSHSKNKGKEKESNNDNDTTAATVSAKGAATAAGTVMTSKEIVEGAGAAEGPQTEEDLARNHAASKRPGYLHDTPQPCSESGMRFDELYRLKGVLGTGAFSTVREGYHRSNAQVSYAVKCINRKKLSEEDEAALLDEVGILKELRHPHIIRLYDFFVEPSTYYLVMERMRGGELFDRIVAKAYYNEKEARDTCKLLLEAVQHCHDNHIAHRDLKPENLLLLSESDDSAVKIADFGFAKKVYERNSLSTQCGTPGYVAPEILEGTPYDERADMWSVGVILYILLGGYPPFIESTQRDLFRKIKRGEYEFHEEYWGTVSQEAKELISELLCVSVNDRLTADEALENQWITGDDEKLKQRDLGANLQKMRNFNAKRKFRAVVSTIIAINKLNSLAEAFFTPLKETVIEVVKQHEGSGHSRSTSHSGNASGGHLNHSAIGTGSGSDDKQEVVHYVHSNPFK